MNLFVGPGLTFDLFKIKQHYCSLRPLFVSNYCSFHPSGEQFPVSLYSVIAIFSFTVVLTTPLRDSVLFVVSLSN